MGSGDRVQFQRTSMFGIGFSVSQFPFAVTVGVHLLFWYLTIGFGKGYDHA